MIRHTFRHTIIQLFYLIFCLLLGSCAVGPNYKRPTMPLPKNYISSPLLSNHHKTQQFIVNQDIPAQWWALFHSKSLNDLVEASLKHNPSVGVAQANLRASLETVYAQRGALYPFVGATFIPNRQKVSQILQAVLQDNSYLFSLYTAELFVSYTPDVFGATRRQIESSVATAANQRFQLEATYLTLSTNVVNAAIQEAATKEQILITKKIIASQRKILTMMRKRKNIGDTSVMDISTQEAALAVSEASLPPLQKQWEIQRNLLNALTGRFPDDPRTPKFTLNELKLPKDLPISLPSTLLEHRPDIRAVEEQMHAANALIGVAVANRLPNVTIGFTNAGSTTTSLSTLFEPNTLFWSLAGIITQPLFDAGTLRHKQRIAEANYQQTVALYRQTVINAFQNMADSLKAIRADSIAFRAATKAAQSTLRSVEISRQQYRLGDSSILNLQINEQLYLNAKLNLIQAQANRLSDTVALFQALGGGWWNNACVKTNKTLVSPK